MWLRGSDGASMVKFWDRRPGGHGPGFLTVLLFVSREYADVPLSTGVALSPVLARLLLTPHAPTIPLRLFLFADLAVAGEPLGGLAAHREPVIEVDMLAFDRSTRVVGACDPPRLD
jgi:hypothetical protein